jgi:glycosyltransferase involved in cell wall biosynthesis
LKDSGTPRISTANLRQATRVLGQFGRELGGADGVLVFGGERFLLTIGALLLALSRLVHKPCYFRVFGGSLDIYDQSLPRSLRRLFRSVLRHADGLIVQTRLLQGYLSGLGNRDVHLVPGYRLLTASDEGPPTSARQPSGAARVTFIGHVREEKGVLVLLEALRRLEADSAVEIQCDIFGPVYESFSGRFHEELAATPSATYGGVLEPAGVIDAMRRYDALVFPSYYEGEGHPGVLIEAMMAGIPAITTGFRSIPELVEDQVNGLLVPPRDTHALERAIREIAGDRGRAKEMGRRNWERRVHHDARRLAPLIAAPLGDGAAGALGEGAEHGVDSKKAAVGDGEDARGPDE